MEPIETSEPPILHEEPEFSHAKFAYASVVIIFLGYQFAGQALTVLFARNGSPMVSAFMQGLGQFLFMLLPSVIVMQYSPLKVQGLMRSGGSVTMGQWVIGLMGILALQLFANGFSSVQEHLIPKAFYPGYRYWERLIDGAYRSLLGGSSAWDAARALAVGAVIPAFSEEILFRGLLQRSLEEVRSPIRSIIVTAVIFGILHMNLISIVPLVSIGAYFGFMAYYTQSLALPIVAHFLNNAFAIVVLYLPEGILPGLSPIVQTLLGLAGLNAAVLLMLRTTPQVASPSNWKTSVNVENMDKNSGDNADNNNAENPNGND